MTWTYIHAQEDWDNRISRLRGKARSKPTNFPCAVSDKDTIIYPAKFKLFLSQEDMIAIKAGYPPRIKGKRPYSRRVVPQDRVEKVQLDADSENFLEFFGSFLKEKREELGLDREKFGFVFGLTKAVMGTLETGRTPCTLERALKFAIVLDIDLKELTTTMNVDIHQARLVEALSENDTEEENEMESLREQMNQLAAKKARRQKLKQRVNE